MMFKEKSITKLYAFALAAVFALTLAGCGGGGGGTAAAPDPEPTPMPSPQETCEADGGRYNADGSCTSAADLAEEMALSDAQGAASMAAAAAMAAVAGAVDPVAMANAYSYASMAQAASDAAAAATTSADAEGHQMAAESARDSAMEAAGERGLASTALANKITNQAAIDNAILEGKTGSDIPKPVSNATRVGTELETTAGEDNARNGTDNVNTNQGGEAGSTAAYNAAGPRFTVTLPTGDILRGEKPTSLMTSGEKPSGGWPGAELVRTDATPGKTYVLAFTDIEAPTQDYTDPTPGANTALTLPTTPANAVSILTGDVPGDGSSFTGTYNANSLDNNPPVSGKFVCPSGVECSISVDADGVIQAIQGYEFHAKAAGLTKTDGDYMAWGVWLTIPDDAATAAATGAFGSGNMVFNVKPQLKGTATYNGDASGLYAAGGMVDYFDADVSLTANFGGAGSEGADSTPGSEAAATDNDGLLIGAVTGSVTNIRAGGVAIDGSLTLKRAPVTRAGNTDASSNTGFNGDIDGTLAGRAMDGGWGGQFYGPSSASGKAAETQYPTTAAGTFSAHAPGHSQDPVRILGAFGAWKAD
ncbi:MAG: hypothetical protein OXQ29_20395 [Rhodospirillaceae bacterium]|nr:hypothetical protein [Rhodospirillaceae bacterium]